MGVSGEDNDGLLDCDWGLARPRGREITHGDVELSESMFAPGGRAGTSGNIAARCTIGITAVGVCSVTGLEGGGDA